MTRTPRNIHGSGSGLARAGFTVIELGVVLVIIVLLAGVLLVALRLAILSSRSAGEKNLCVSLRMATEQFKQQFGFLPPVVDDLNGPLERSGNEPDSPLLLDITQEARTSTPNFDRFYSTNSLGYYLIGATDKKTDGVDGPGFTFPKDEGTDGVEGHFARKGKTYEALFDVNKDRKRLVSTGPETAPIRQLIDRWSKPLRYYRWEPSYYDRQNQAPVGVAPGSIRSYNVPRVIQNVLGTPDQNPKLRQGGFAIVSSGPDGLFSDQAPSGTSAADAAKLDADNIVEIGR